MLRLDLTLADAAENLALDEALLEEAEAGQSADEILRFWEPAAPLVVIGRSSRPEAEVRLDRCAQDGVPVLRRASGGASIVTGPGCLMYAVVLSYERRPELRSIDAAHRYVLGRLVEALKPLVPGIAQHGTSDLALATSDPSGLAHKKCSGNSMRAKRQYMLYHGTLLYDFDLSLVERYLRHPPREPQYRAGRRHEEFIANLPVSGEQLRAAIASVWEANASLDTWPNARTSALVAEKYSDDAWNA